MKKEKIINPDILDHPDTIYVNSNQVVSWNKVSFEDKIAWLLAHNWISQEIRSTDRQKPGFGKQNRRKGRGGLKY